MQDTAKASKTTQSKATETATLEAEFERAGFCSFLQRLREQEVAAQLQIRSYLGSSSAATAALEANAISLLSVVSFLVAHAFSS